MKRMEKLGPFRYEWGEGCFPLGRDSLLLGEFSTLRPGWRICDLGCGAGALLLLLLGRESSLSVKGVELSAASAALARHNLAQNGLNGEIITGDLRLSENLPSPGSCDLAISNPPWFRAGAGRSGGSTRMEENCSIEELCGAAGRILRSGGRFALVHTPERLTDLLCALRSAALEPKRICCIQHSPDRAPSAVLVEAVRQGRPGLIFLPPRCG